MTRLIYVSEEATTCCIAVIRCPVTGVVAAIHVDGGSMRDIAPLRFILQQMREVTSETFFKVKSHVFLDTFILKIRFYVIKINNFRGDRSDFGKKRSTSLVLRSSYT